MDEIIEQGPEGIKYEELLSVYIKNSSNVVETLSELWNLKENKKNISIEQNKWNEIREICDTYDSEIYNIIKK